MDPCAPESDHDPIRDLILRLNPATIPSTAEIDRLLRQLELQQISTSNQQPKTQI